MNCAVTVNLIEEARGGPFVFWHDLPAACRTAAELGFDAIELFLPSADAVDRRQLKILLVDHGLALAGLGTGGGWIKQRLTLVLPDAKDRQRAQEFIRTIIDLGAEFGAPAVVGSMQGRSTDEVDRASAKHYLAEALSTLGDYAEERGVPLLYEPLNRFETNLCNTIADALRLLDSLSTRGVRLLADLFHMNIEEADMAKAIFAAGDRLGHVHFVDSNRRAAGFGHIEYAPLIAALREIGYDGYLSAEALPLPDSRAAAEQTIKMFRALLT